MIDAEKANYKIAWMCRLLRVPRSSFYAWRNKAETATAARRRELASQVRRVFEEGRGAYGCRRVAAQLNRDGHRCSVGLVADLMRELGLRACQPRAYKRTTVPGEQPVISPDLIGRDFTAAAPGTRLVGDITYPRTGEGWLYLATVIDLATKMVTGWQLAGHMRTSLVTDALDMAITHGHIQPGAIFHSDKGAQGESPFVASIRLRSNEPLPVVRLIMQGATVAECPVGFPRGAAGVEPDAPEYQPPGWRNDALARCAAHLILFPNDRAIFPVELHPQAHDLNPVPEVAHARADCTGLEHEEWIVPVTLKLAQEVKDAMRPPPTVTVC